MLSAFTNVVRIPELRQRILFTIAIIFIVRMGANIPLPGISSETLGEMVNKATQAGEDGGGTGAAAITSMLAMFTGGALQQAAVFSLGIMPYISASIIMQMLTVLVPPMAKIQREEGGRQKIGQYTRYLTIILCIGQGYMLLASLQNPAQNPFLQNIYDASMGPLVTQTGLWNFILPGLLILVAGTMLLLWLGEMITEKGIGNGVSIIITVNIIAALPGTIVLIWETMLTGENANALSGIALVILVSLLLLLIAGVISVTQGQRRIPVQYPKQAARGRKMVGSNSQTSYLPLKVNYSGVMPVIFGSALMLLPVALLPPLFKKDDGTPQDWVIQLQNSLSIDGWIYYLVMSAMIFAFSFFWVSIFFQPQQMADDLKRGGGYVPGVRPGKATADFLDRTMTRLTFSGATFLSLIVIVPALIFFLMSAVFNVGIPTSARMIFGGTSIMIMVGVLLDIMKQLETHLIQRNYEGFLRKGRIKGGRYGRVGGTNQVVRKDKAGPMLWLYVVLAIIAMAGSILLLISDRREAREQNQDQGALAPAQQTFWG